MTRKQPNATNTAILRSLVEEAERKNGPTFDVPYKGKPLHLRRITVEASLPMYRVQNGRTHKAQIEYLADHPSLPKTFFSDPDDPKVQAAQHKILCSMISQKALDDDLNERGQHDPLVLTADGMVLDGNRRLVALRIARVQHVEAVVLPDTATPKDMYETEIELQMQRDTKADYSWIDQALHVEYGINQLGESFHLVAKRMRLDENDVKEQRVMLDYARQYVSWIGEEGLLHKIPSDADGESKQIFREIAVRLGSAALRKLSEAERRGIRDLCFRAIKEGKGYEAVRNIIKQLSQNPSKVNERLSERLPVRVAASPAQLPLNKTATRSEKPNPLAALASAAPRSSTELGSMSEVAKNERAGLAVIEVIDDLTAEQREQKKGPVQRAQKALDLVRAIELSPSSPDLDDLARVLSELLAEVEGLAKRIEKARR